MTSIAIPKGLPKSRIIDELVLKYEGQASLTINPLSIIDEFRKRVTDEAKYINQLFPPVLRSVPGR